MNEIPRASVRQLGHKINDCKQRFALLLGAGASRQSDVITASEMVKNFKEKVFAECCPKSAESEDDKEKWLADQEWYKKQGSDYCKLFEKFEPKESGRQRYIESIIDGKEPSFGYVVLANLMASGYINTVITTNFDDLLYSACTNYTRIRPVVYAYGVLEAEMRLTGHRPKILKIHGDYLYSKLKNTNKDLARTQPNMARKLRQILGEYGLIVIGYAGNDDSVMKVLKDIPVKNDLYWCDLQGMTLSPKVTELLVKKKGFMVEIEGFDEMMNEIRTEVKFDVGKLIGALRFRQDQMIQNLKAPARDYGYGYDTVDILDEMLQALEDQVKKGGEQLKTIQATRSFVNALKAHEAGDLKEAEKHYRKAVELDPKDALAYNNLGIVLGEDPRRRQQAELAYRQAIALNPDSATAYYNLAGIIDESPLRSDETKETYLKAIELNPNFTDAFQNLVVLLRLRKDAPEEIRTFAERLLQLDSRNIDALLALASIHRQLKHARKSKEYAAQAREQIKPDDWYYLACVEAVCGNKDAAFENLKQAALQDSFDAEWAGRDPDLAWIGNDRRFGKIIGSALSNSRGKGRKSSPRKKGRVRLTANARTTQRPINRPA